MRCGGAPFFPAMLAALANAGCQSLVDDYSADLEVEAPIRSSRLCAIETNEFAFSVDFDSDERQESLFDYYEEQNPEFIDHIKDVVKRYGAGETAAEVTYLLGAAGVGKTFLLRALDDLDEAKQCTVDLDELFVEEPGRLDFEVAYETDLETLDGGDLVFNELPSLAKPSDFTLESLLEAGDCYVGGELVPLVFIDGIDEVHDDTARLILELLDEFVAEEQGVHFLVAGRPEGFAVWLTDPDRNEDSNDPLTRFDLVPPRYDSAGDLEFRATGYWDFTMQVVEDDYLDNFEQAVSSHPFLTYTLGNLAFGNFVVEHTGPGEEVSEEEIKIGVFDDILLRNADTHDRPGTDSALNGAYRRALEEVAVRYADVNDQGVFIVRSEDTVPVTDDSGSVVGEIRVRTLLNHSGAAVLTAANATTTRYRFDPFWFHAHLIERYNQRHFPGYRYHGCD